MHKLSKLSITVLVVALLLLMPLAGKTDLLAVPVGIQQPTSTSNQSDFSISIGNVSASYLDLVYLPVNMSGGQDFSGINQTFSFDPSLLQFNGTLSDASSQNVSFSSQTMSNGVIQVVGDGAFNVSSSQTTLYYLIFNPVLQTQIVTTVLLDESTVGQTLSNATSQSTVTLTSPTPAPTPPTPTSATSPTSTTAPTPTSTPTPSAAPTQNSASTPQTTSTPSPNPTATPATPAQTTSSPATVDIPVPEFPLTLSIAVVLIAATLTLLACLRNKKPHAKIDPAPENAD